MPTHDEDAKKEDWMGVEDSEDEHAGSASDSETEQSRFRTSKRRKLSRPSSAPSDIEDEDEDAEDTVPSATADDPPIAASTPASDTLTDATKLKPLTPAQLAASKAALSKSGVVYLSRIPPFMKPSKVRDLLSKFGAIGRLFLAPEDPKAHAKRVKFGGNKKRNFEEGWVEFLSKKDAKLCAETLNANIIGGKKGNFYHDDIWNIKYLPKFKWHHLSAQIAYENASRQAKLRAEIAKDTKVNKTFLRNYERAKMVETMQEAKKKKRKLEDCGVGEKAEPETIEVRRQFRQHKPKGSAAESKTAGTAEKIFSSVF